MATQIVKAIIDKSWIPKVYESANVSFFSQEDIWVYFPEWDEKLCDECGEFAIGIPYFSGVQIRSAFPYMDIVGPDTIAVNVHPNCRCHLEREGSFSMEVLSKNEAKKAFIERELSLEDE